MTLSGKALYGVQSGTVRVNGRLASLERYKRVMGFVPQVRGSVIAPGSNIHPFVSWFGELPSSWIKDVNHQYSQLNCCCYCGVRLVLVDSCPR